MQVTGIAMVTQGGRRLIVSDSAYLRQQRRILRREIRQAEKRAKLRMASAA